MEYNRTPPNTQQLQSQPIQPTNGRAGPNKPRPARPDTTIRVWRANGNTAWPAFTQAPDQAAAADAKTVRIHYEDGTIVVDNLRKASARAREEKRFSAAGIMRAEFAATNRLNRSAAQQHPAHAVRAPGAPLRKKLQAEAAEPRKEVRQPGMEPTAGALDLRRQP
jgi:hypothetical protein